MRQIRLDSENNLLTIYPKNKRKGVFTVYPLSKISDNSRSRLNEILSSYTDYTFPSIWFDGTFSVNYHLDI